MDKPPVKIDIALVHYPVVNKNGEAIGSSVTNLDLHDMGRAARTFGVNCFWVVTPFRDQQALFAEVLEHWRSGHGARYNDKRGEALRLVEIVDDIDFMLAASTEKWGRPPLVLATCARPGMATIGYDEARQRLAAGEPLLVLFGTAWGLAPEVLERASGTLPAITGCGEYNHLSVRSAAAIILDRLQGER